MRFRIFALACGALIAAAPGAQAQLSSRGGPIGYSANSGEYQDQARMMILTGNVDLTQGCARMQADKLTLYFKPNASQASSAGMASGDIDRIIAEGEVHFVRPDLDQRARGDRAVYEATTDSVTMTGNVVLTTTNVVQRGETLTFEVGKGRAMLTPAGKPGERVRGVLNPKDKNAPSTAPAAKPAC